MPYVPVLGLMAAALASSAPSASFAQVQPPLAQETVVLPDGTRLEKSQIPALAATAELDAVPSATCAAAPPTLVSPAQDAVSNDLANPRYTWTTVAGVTEYVFQLAQNSTFNTPLTSEQETASARSEE
ncbi:MAG: hypothetical protein HGA45_38630, partial [Chloroflexales bacterium]|nr:hypothetical protein [Chloroflexales bacterium]